MSDLWAHFSWMTFLVVLIAAIIVVVGGIKVIMGDLTYEAWVNDLWHYGIALAGTAIGRGIWKQGQGSAVTHVTRKRSH